MKLAAVTAVSAALLIGASFAFVQDMPPKPQPTKEHQWLQQFVGEWTGEAECSVPNQAPIKGTSTERVRKVGDLWVISDMKGSMGGMEMEAVFSIGYDPEKKSVVATWLDSSSSHLWTYTGAIDLAKNTLTLETEGPNMMDPTSTKSVKYREVTEFKGKNERVFTSNVQGADGKWTPMAKGVSKRKGSA